MIADVEPRVETPKPERKKPVPPSQKGRLRPDRNWVEIRQTYAKGSHTLAMLSQTYGVPMSTLTNRCAKEGWAKTTRSISTKSMDIALNRAIQAKTSEADALVARSLDQANRLLDTVDQDIADGFSHVLQPDGTIKETRADRLGKVVSAWQKVIQVGRQAHGLGDGPQLHVVRHISDMKPVESSQVIDVEQVASEVIIDPMQGA